MKKPKQSPADAAFTAPDTDTLGDLKLEPWTPERIIQAQTMGLVFPNTGKTGWDQLQQTGVYPGAVRDAIIFLYLSSLPAEQVEDATWRDAKAFGTKRGIHDTDGKPFWDAYSLFMKVQREINASIGVPKGSDDTAEDEDETDPKA